jgi:hypothetical protein
MTTYVGQEEELACGSCAGVRQIYRTNAAASVKSEKLGCFTKR